MMKKILLILAVVFILASCAPEPGYYQSDLPKPSDDVSINRYLIVSEKNIGYGLSRIDDGSYLCYVYRIPGYVDIDCFEK